MSSEHALIIRKYIRVCSYHPYLCTCDIYTRVRVCARARGCVLIAYCICNLEEGRDLVGLVQKCFKTEENRPMHHVLLGCFLHAGGDRRLHVQHVLLSHYLCVCVRERDSKREKESYACVRASLCEWVQRWVAPKQRSYIPVYMHAYIRTCMHTHMKSCAQAHMPMHPNMHTNTHAHLAKLKQAKLAVGIAQGTARCDLIEVLAAQ